MSKQPAKQPATQVATQAAKQPATKEDTLKPGQYLEADNVIIRYMGPKDADGKYAVRVEDKFGRKKPTGLLRLSSDGMRRDDALPRAQELLKKQPDQSFKLGRFTVTPVIKPAAKKEGGRKSRRKKKHRRRRTRKRKRKRKQTKRKRVKRRRKTTRKKRGRGISPSRMAKGAVATLAASEMMKQGSATVSPQGRDVQQRLRSANCDTIAEQGRQLIKPLHPDHGGTDEDFIAGMNTLTHRRGQCKLNRQRGDTEKGSKSKPERRAGESAKKARQRERRERQAKAEAAKKAKEQEERVKAAAAKKAKEQEEQAKAKARAKAQEEADARAGQQQSSTKPSVASEIANVGLMGVAAAGAGGAANQLLGKKEERRTSTHRFDFGDGNIRRFEGPFPRRGRSRIRVADGSYWRERTPESRNQPATGPVYSNFLGNIAYHT